MSNSARWLHETFERNWRKENIDTATTTAENSQARCGAERTGTAPMRPVQLPAPQLILPTGTTCARILFSAIDQRWAIGISLLCGWTGLIRCR
jgi:hypothetical protein